MNAKIVGAGGTIPRVVDNAEFIRVFGKKATMVDKMLPHKSRYSAFNLDTFDTITTNTDMALQSSLLALSSAGLQPDDVDMIIYSTITPDYLAPPCFALLQEKLGIHSCMGFDIRSGCAGFGTAIICAAKFIECEMVNNVLVVGAELVSSRILCFKDHLNKVNTKTLYNLMLFGDGAGSVVLQATENPLEGITAMQMNSDMPQVPNGFTCKIGGSVCPYPTPEVPMNEWPCLHNFGLTLKYVPKVMISAMERFLSESHTTLDDYDYYIFPVDSPNMGSAIQKHFHIDEGKVLSVSQTGGALANASVPLEIFQSASKLKYGDRILVYTGENTKWQHAIFSFIWSI